MRNVIKFFGIIAMVAVIGFSMAACGDDEGDLYAGTWAMEGNSVYRYVISSKLTFEYGTEGGLPSARGKIAINGDAVTVTETDFYQQETNPMGWVKRNPPIVTTGTVDGHTSGSKMILENGTYIKQ